MIKLNLYHNGHTPKDSEGCMLINDYVVDKFDDIVFEDKQENKNKEQRLKDSLIKGFTKEILGKRTNSIKDFVKNYVEVRVKNNFNPTQKTKQELPDNVIRIQTQDDSDEFIEIELPKENEMQEKSWLDASLDMIENAPLLHTKILKMPKLIKKGYNSTKEIFQSKPKSLTMQEVLEIVDELEKVFNKKGEDTGIRLVKSKKELEAAVDKRYGKPIYRRQLDDGTKINYRVDSKTGGETIDINNKNPKVNIKIHIDKKI